MDREPRRGQAIAWEELTRRTLLRRSGQAAALIALPSFVAACGDDEEEGGAGTTGQGGAPNISGEIDFFGFEGEDFPEQVKPWADQNGVELRSKYAATAPDIIARVLGGQGQGIDLISFPTNWTQAYNANGILTPIDPARIPNYAMLAEVFKSGIDEFTKNEKGELIAVPFQWHTLGITYDSSAVPEVTSYEQLLEPEFKNKLVIIDLPIAVLQVACVITGYDPTTLTKPQVDETVDLVSRYVAQAKTISPSPGDAATLLGSGEVVAVYDGYPNLNSLAAQQGNENVVTNMEPEEGFTASVELYGVPPTVDNEDAALAMINHVLDPKVNAEINSARDNGSVSEDGAQYVSKANRQLYPYDDIAGYLEQARLMNNPPAESKQYLTAPAWLETWQGLKSKS